MDGWAPIEVVSASRSTWPDIERLFGPAGASNGCWCQYWLLGADYKRRNRSENRRDLEHEVGSAGSGLVAYRDGEAVGWARLTQRSKLDWLRARFSRHDFGSEDAWCLPCFFVARSARGNGVMTRLVEYGARWAREHGAALEGYPIDTEVDGASRNVFPGTLQAFLRAGFVERGRLARDRAVVVAGA